MGMVELSGVLTSIVSLKNALQLMRQVSEYSPAAGGGGGGGYSPIWAI